MLVHKIKKYSVTLLACLGLLVAGLLIAPGSAGAFPVTCPDGYKTDVSSPDAAARACENHQTGGPEEDTVTASFSADCKDAAINSSNCGIVRYLVDFIRILSAVVGVVVVIMIAVGGVQYSSARDNPQASAAAKGRITNAIIALVVYLFMFAFLQWLVPGGIL